jgi:hypothetical protein
MDLYHIWCDLKPGVKDLEFCADVARYMDRLKDEQRIEGWRLTRKKLGFGPPEMGEFHIVVETRDLSQLEQAFQRVATRAGEIEGFHAAVNQVVASVRFALYRDFPDSVRTSGEERF